MFILATLLLLSMHYCYYHKLLLLSLQIFLINLQDIIIILDIINIIS